MNVVVIAILALGSVAGALDEDIKNEAYKVSCTALITDIVDIVI